MNIKLAVFFLNCILNVVCAKYYNASKTNKFCNFAVDQKNTRNVYIGGDRMLYKLDMDLNENVKVCTLPGETTQTECSNTETNPNQVLVIGSEGLVTCWWQSPGGTCQLRQFSDLMTKSNIETDIISNLTVAYISNIYPDNALTQALFVAKSYIHGTSVKISEFGLITARSLENFKILNDDEITSVGIFLKSDNNVSLYYKSGFSYNNFNYFFTNQDRGPKTPNISKLAQLCNNESDSVRLSYIDMPIVCHHNGKNYSLLQDAARIEVGKELSVAMNVSEDEQIIAAVFSFGNDSDPQPSSALCLYTFHDVQQMLHQNRITWVSGKCLGTHNPYIQGNDCSSTPWKVDDHINPGMCSTFAAWNNITGETPLTAEAVYTINEHLTSVTGRRFGKYGTAYVGSSGGDVYKLYLKNDTVAVRYDKVTATSGYPVRDITIVDDAVYIMTEKQLYKQSTTNCSQHDTCHKCMDTGDPVCGWCVSTNKCCHMDRIQCLLNHWLPAVDHKCLMFHTNPETIPVSIDKTAYVTILLSPSLNLSSNLQCKFGDHDLDDADVILGGNPRCMAPANKVRGNMNVGVFYNKTNLATGNLFYYDCSMPSSCVECSNEDDACVWCIGDGMCRSDSFCIDPLRHFMVSECPRLVETSKYVPEGVESDLYVEGQKLPDPKKMDGYMYRCEDFNVTTNDIFVNSSYLFCGKHTFRYSHNTSQIKVFFGNKKKSSELYEIDTIHKVTLHVYKCQDLFTDCSRCRNPNDNYQCSWCSNDTCQHASECDRIADKCPPPIINSVSPQMGLIDGGVLITITGTELGSSEDDVNSVGVGGAECMVKNFSISERIICNTSSVNEAADVSVKVNISGQVATYPFSYKNPKVTAIEPHQGIMAGGSVIVVTVVHMPLEKDSQFPEYLKPEILFEVDNGTKKCVINKISRVVSNSIVKFECTIPKVSQPQKIKVIVKLTKAVSRESSEEKKFSYTVNPSIDGVHPIKSFVSGGRLMTVSGTGFKNVQVARIVDENGSFLETCDKRDDTALICKFPKAPASVSEQISRKKRRTKRGTCQQCFTIIFQMDGFERNYTIEYVIDPSFFNFSDPNSVKEFIPSEGTKLHIMGKNLTLAATKEDVLITVGNANCSSVLLSETEVVCVPPDEKPESEKEYPPVVVTVGNIRRNIGYLEYKEELRMLYIIIGVLVSVLIVVVVGSVFVYRHIHQKKQKCKELVFLMEDRENKLRDIWRNEFVSLVDCNDIIDIKSELVKSGLPFNDFQTYVFHVMFPSEQIQNHHLLRYPVVTDDERVKIEKGMAIFEQLLFNKFFLEVAISALNKQKKMRLKEKAEFSSILSLLLMGQMDYFTEIIKVLISRLVEESVPKKQQRVLFKRIETISEKLLSFWMSLSMYCHVKLHAGSPLFMLFKATQILMESNPIDGVTHDAKFTLMEDKILTDTEEGETITLNIELNENIFPCKVLKCDTIHQVKEKCLSAIYKNMYASKCPAADDVDLEWHEGKNGQIILHNIDDTSEREFGWIRHNTLSHYAVKDGSRMVLLSTEVSGEDDEIIYVNTTKLSELKESTASVNSVQISLTDEKPLDVHYWHLVKHNEDDNTRADIKDMTDLYLPRLLSTKLSLMEYIEAFNSMIFQTNEVPMCVKYLYDLMDDLGDRHSLDSSVLHSWKSHSYIIRYWASLVNKPEILFDVHKVVHVENCLDVVGQILIDACATALPKYGKNSPMHKVLFKKEIKECQHQVKSFFKNVSLATQLSEQHVMDRMREQSKMFSQMFKFNKMAALFEVYKMMDKFMDDIVVELEENNKTKHLQLGNKLETVQAIINGEV